MTGTFTVAASQSETVTFGAGATFAAAGAGWAALSGAGTISSSGTIGVGNNGSVALYLEDDVTWVNHGVVNDAGQIDVGVEGGDTATIDNASGATFNVSAQGSTIQIGSGGAIPGIINAGTFVKSAGSGTSSIGVAFTNTGTIEANSGTLEFTGGGILGGTIGGGGGNVVLAGTYSVASGVVDTVTFGSGDSFAAAGSNTAYLSGAGTITSAGTIAVSSNGGVALFLEDDVIWTNNGVVNDAGQIDLGDSNGDNATLDNASGATFNLSEEGSAVQIGYGNATGSIVNAGTFLKSAGGGTSSVNVKFTNTGTIAANSDTLAFTDGGVLGGTIGGDGGNVVLTGVYSFAAGQTTETVKFAPGASFAAAGSNAAYLNGAGTISSSGSVAVGNNGQTALYLEDNLIWVNNGVVNDAGQIDLGAFGGDNATIENASGATFNVSAQGSAIQIGYGSATGSIVNAGTFAKSAGSGTSSIDVGFTNTGTIAADSGTLDFTGGGTNQSGGSIVAQSGATFEFDGSVFTNNGTIGANGGSVVINANITGTGSATIGAGGSLTLGGSDAQAIDFTGAGATLSLGHPGKFTGAINGLQIGDVIDMVDTAVTGTPSVTGSSLTVDTGSGPVTYQIHGELTGTVFTTRSDGAGGTDLTLAAPPETITLTTSVHNYVGNLGDDTFVAVPGTLAGASIDGGGGYNTLVLQGTGGFNLANASALVDIAIIQAADVGQSITLRAGTHFTIDVAKGSKTVNITGAANDDVINLGVGDDTVTLGGPNETVQGGGGRNTINATAAAAGALIDLGADKSVLNVSGGGTATLASGDNGLATVTLASAAGAYDFTANAENGLTINDMSAGNGYDRCRRRRRNTHGRRGGKTDDDRLQWRRRQIQ